MVFLDRALAGGAQAGDSGARRGSGEDHDELSVADRRERRALLERVPGELERVADRERRLLDPADHGEELSGGVQPGGGGVAAAGVDRLAVDEALDQVSSRSTALRSEPGLFAQVRLGGLGGDGVDPVDRRAGEREAGFSGDPQA